MTKYRKKRVVIEAVKWDGSRDSLKECLEFINFDMSWAIDGENIPIYTKEGRMIASIGDYIIKEPFPTEDRQFYPCKPDIFEQTYEKIEEKDWKVNTFDIIPKIPKMFKKFKGSNFKKELIKWLKIIV